MESDKPPIDRKSIKFMQCKNLGNRKVIGGGLFMRAVLYNPFSFPFELVNLVMHHALMLKPSILEELNIENKNKNKIIKKRIRFLFK